MNYKEAVKNYEKDISPENLKKQVEALLAEMTIEEKIFMLSGRGGVQAIKNQLFHKRMYNYEPIPAGGCKRLGIPAVLFTDGPRGVVMHNSTCFPVSMCRASAFDEDLEYRIGKAIADEAIAQGANFFAGICINLVRNPRWGRAQESYGEDPYLLGVMGTALTKSVQEEGIIACPKHYALNSIEDLRFYINVTASERTLHEVYLPHFKKCIDAGALSIMGAYNRYDQSYCCESKKLLTDILRNTWGFDGFVMSDFVYGVRDAERALRSGCDMEMLFTLKFRAIKKMLADGRLNITHIDRAAKNILGVLIRLTPKIKPRNINVVASEKNRELAREAAEKGMVLLQNNGLLPLQEGIKIAVTGDYASSENTGDHGSSRVYSENIITPYRGLAELFDAALYNGTVPDKALAAADNCETVVVCAGSNSNLEGEYFASAKYNLKTKPANSGGDRASLHLTTEEINLIKALKKAGKKVVAVLYSGCAIITEEWKEYTDAVIMNYYSGVEGGRALANILCGRVNPSGKLPFTVARNEKDYPPITGIGDKPYEIEYGYYHGYTLFDKENIKPAYPFGFGLSYTNFNIKNVKAQKEGEGVKICCRVKNTGQKDGAEVVQVYAGSNGAQEDRPVKLLKGFKRVKLAAGEEQEVTIKIGIEELKFYDCKTHNWVLDKSYTFFIGNSSEDAMKERHNIDFT
jgi:beta-glucosidase